MQRELIVNLSDWKKSGLDLTEYVILQMIHEGIDVMDKQIYNISDILHDLQEEMWIKILEDGIEPRQKLIELFEKNYDAEISEVLTYLNEKTGREFMLRVSSNRKFVSGRLREGYTVQDMKSVVDVMYDKWKGTDWEDYLRPETLFKPTKFQSYINAAKRMTNKKADLNRFG